MFIPKALSLRLALFFIKQSREQDKAGGDELLLCFTEDGAEMGKYRCLKEVL